MGVTEYETQAQHLRSAAVRPEKGVTAGGISAGKPVTPLLGVTECESKPSTSSQQL
ncbi:hypothetical protein NNL21_27455 [Paenibacillus mendelii]|nr:hypothetical protein [Paenibacillus mendelii]